MCMFNVFHWLLIKLLLLLSVGEALLVTSLFQVNKRFFHLCSWTLKVDSVTYGIRTVVLANLSSSLGSVTIHGEKETKMTGTLSCKSMSPKSMWQSSVSWTLRMLGRDPWRGSSWSTMYLMVSMEPLLLRCSLMGQGWRQSCKKESSKILRE